LYYTMRAIKINPEVYAFVAEKCSREGSHSN
jgi:hypothetical protein